MSAEMEPFSIIETTESRSRPGPHHLWDDVLKLSSAKSADHDFQYTAALREANPGMILTVIPRANVDLRVFAAAGFASCEVDKETDSYASWRGYVGGSKREEEGGLGEVVYFAKYHYKWGNEDFILYTVNGNTQYILKERREGEHPLGPSRATDSLIKAIGAWMTSILDVVWVYDNYWQTSRELYQQVMKSSWGNVILDEGMKKDLTSVANKFFSSKQTYQDLGVPWKRGLMFYGPPGNGKTISIRALMHELYSRKDKAGNAKPIPTLYVKSAPRTWDIGQVFQHARRMAPCMLILEDVETIVTSQTRSYFFNEMDGLENNDGLFVVASTNFLEKLDPGLTKRPSRFDRKYLFPIPNEHERTLYCEFWRRKLKSNKSIEFPKKLCPAMAHVTPGFSFAFLQECFVATLLIVAREQDEAVIKPYDSENDDLEDYRLWVVFKKEAEVLKKEIDDQKDGAAAVGSILGFSLGEGPTTVPPPPSMIGAGFETSLGRYTSPLGFASGQQYASLPVRQRDEVLPELPYYQQKQSRINPKAFEKV